MGVSFLAPACNVAIAANRGHGAVIYRPMRKHKFFIVGCLMLALSALAAAQEVPAHIKAALTKADAAVAKIIAVPNNQRTFENTLGALDDLSVRLDNETSLFTFLQFVSTDAKERE